MDYAKYINWGDIPESITHVRFEAIIMTGTAMTCYGIEIVKRPDAPGNAQQVIQPDNAQ